MRVERCAFSLSLSFLFLGRGKSAKVGRFGFQGFEKQKKLQKNASVRCC